MADIDGVDISHWQNQTIDYVAAKKAGVKFLYHKATEGSSYRDPNYARRREESRKAGIPFGAYHFARPEDSADAVKEAEWFINVAQPKPGDMIPVLDFEVSNSLTRDQMSKWVETFVATVKKRGFKVMIYTPFNLNSTYGCPLWVARYSNAMYAPRIPSPWKRYDVWQFSNGTYGSPKNVPGVGYVDINTLHPECSLESLRIPKVAPAPAPTPTPTPTGTFSTINIMHASMQFSDSAAQMRSDLEKIFALKQDAITFTEAHHTNALYTMIPEIGKKYGYEVYAHKYGLAVAVKKSYATKLSTGYATGISGSRIGDPDVYAPRGVAWMAVRSKAGEIITISVTHYITGGRTPRDGFRYFENLKLSRAVGRLAKWGGDRTKLFFCNGDMNLPDKVNDVFHGQPLTTCWDELKKWPDTGHGNIDVIASYDPDTRVSCTDAFVFNDKRLPLNTDHYLIFAKYKIKAINR